MKVGDLKYLCAYIIPALCIYGLYHGGVWSWSALIFAFGIVPIMEYFLPVNPENISSEDRGRKSITIFFDVLLYINIPIVYFIIYKNSSIASTLELSDYVGNIVSSGISLGACGINVAHELGHRNQKLHQFAAKILLIPCLYSHFNIEHNRGHHKHVATPKDPATSRINEPVYLFWIRAVIGVYTNAWRLENKRLVDKGKHWLDISNEMILSTLATISYLTIVYSACGKSAMVSVILIGIVSFLLLETIDYIEHYGLLRDQLPSGRYERVQPKHSWNSDHVFGRIMLYELTRHSDHHFLANKEYQLLDHHENSPQLPLGYPASMLLSLVPPLWFRYMNPRINNANNKYV